MPKPVDATIAITPSSVLQLGGQVNFETTFEDPKGPHGPIFINVLAFEDPDHVLVWAQSGEPSKTWILGSPYAPGSWSTSANGEPPNTGPKQCRAELAYWAHNKYQLLAAVDFEAAGA